MTPLSQKERHDIEMLSKQTPETMPLMAPEDWWRVIKRVLESNDYWEGEWEYEYAKHEDTENH